MGDSRCVFDIEHKLFHGINLGNYRDARELPTELTTLSVLRSILETGKILTREDLYLSGSIVCYYMNDRTLQEQDEVCLAFHPKNGNFLPKEKRTIDAFDEWVLDGLSIILSDQILANSIYKQAGLPKEIRVKKSIELKNNILAIGYHDEIAKIICDINEKILLKDYDALGYMFFKNYYAKFLRARDIRSYINNIYYGYDNNEIKEILTEHGYNIPIVDPLTGRNYTPIEEAYIEAEKTLIKIRKLVVDGKIILKR